MSTHNIGFYEDLTKNILELSSNKRLISSAVRNPGPNMFSCDKTHFIMLFEG